LKQSIYPPDVKVYCMIRAKDDEQALARLKADMETALVWNPANILCIIKGLEKKSRGARRSERKGRGKIERDY
jgi:hypothetical protein